MATLLKVLSLSRMQSLAPARHVTDALVHEIRRQPQGGPPKPGAAEEQQIRQWDDGSELIVCICFVALRARIAGHSAQALIHSWVLRVGPLRKSEAL